MIEKFQILHCTAIAISFGAAFILSAPIAAQSIAPASDGTGTIVTPDGNRFDIHGGQLSGDGRNLFHSFDRFGLNPGEIANFLTHPNIDTILGRISGGDPSYINGLIQVSGGDSNLFLMNPAGILFGTGASLNVPGDFTATTATSIGFNNGSEFSAIGSNNWANLIGNPAFFQFAIDPGAIVNEGNLAVAPDRSLNLFGGTVVNTGTLQAPGGNISVMAVPGESLIRLSPVGGILSLELPQTDTAPHSLSLAELLTGDGIPTASTVTLNPDGSVTLAGSDTPIDPQPGTTLISGSISVSGGVGTRPSLDILGTRVGLFNAQLDASAADGGGTIRIGGDRQGLGTVPNAQYTFADSNTRIVADALQQGDGGEVIVWADEATQFYGNIFARGGIAGGNGGFIETSGKHYLDVTGARANASATLGNAGTWLLDPSDITISGTPTVPGGLLSPFNPTGAVGNVLNTDINAALDSGVNVTITTAGGTGGNGDIQVLAPIAQTTTTGGTLTLLADRSLFVNADITASGSPMNVTLTADNDGDRSGAIVVGAGVTIASNGGNITLSGGAGRAYGVPGVGAGEGVNISGTLNAGTGNILIQGEGAATGGVGVILHRGRLETTSGNITVTGTGAGAGNNLYGIFGLGNSVVSTADGTIALTGTGTSGSGSDNDGIEFNIARIEATGAGNINLTGTATNGVGTRNGTLEIHNGTATLSGTSATLAGVRTGQILATGTGSILLNGESDATIGVRITDPITTTGGNITATSSDLIVAETTAVLATGGGNLNFTGGSIVLSTSISTLGTNGGNINLTATSGDINAGEIATYGWSGNGGNITLQSQGNITSGAVITNGILNGGSVRLTAPGDIEVGYIDTRGFSFNGGNIDISAGQFFRATGGIATGFGNTSLLSNGSVGAGTISVTHGGNGITPFIVGDGTTNGTAGIVLWGLTAEMMLLSGSFPYTYTQDGGNFNLISVPEPPIEPTPTVEEILPEAEAEEGLLEEEQPPLEEIALEPEPLPEPELLTEPEFEVISEVIPLPATPAPPPSPTPEPLPVSPPSPTPEPLPVSPPSPIPEPLPVSPPSPIPEPLPVSPPSLTPESEASPETERTFRVPSAVVPDFERNINFESDAIASIDLADASPLAVGLEQALASGNLGEAISEVETVRDRDYRSHLGLSPFDGTPKTQKEIQAMLRDVADRSSVRTALVYVMSFPDRLEIIVVPPDAPPVRYQVPEATKTAVLETVQELRRTLTNPRLRGTTDYLASAQQLYRWTIAPIQADLETWNIDTLLLSVDEGLRSIPWAALHDGSQFAIEHYDFSLIPSINLMDTAYTPLPDRSVLAMGASEFTDKQALPAVPAELNTVTQNGAMGAMLLNDEFTPENFLTLRQTAEFDIVHVATHAVFQSGDASQSYIQFWGDRVDLMELPQLHLTQPPVDLLVLSACQTAVGDREAELGFAGLAVRAGVKSVVASLWSVNDEGTLVLMSHFYDRLGQVPFKSQALRQAQLAMLAGRSPARLKAVEGSSDALAGPSLPDRDFSHPYYWSGFTSIGSPW